MIHKHSETHKHPLIKYVGLSSCFLAMIFLCAAEAASARKKFIVLDVQIKNDIGVENAGSITTRWLIDSINRLAPDVQVVTEQQAQRLARLKNPIDVRNLSPAIVGTLTKSIGATAILSADISSWDKRYAVTLKQVNLPNVQQVRIERAWAESPDGIPAAIDSVARLFFAPAEKIQAADVSSKKAEPAKVPPEQPRTQRTNIEHKRETSKTEALLKKHPEMVLVPGGEFVMGNNNDSDADNMPADPARREGVSRLLLIAAEKPEHKVNLRSFLIDKCEVTNAEYKKFKPGHTFPPQKANHPVTGISWHDAKAYAAWADKRLPTEEEWEKAARGADARKWPWGNIFFRGYCNLGADTAPVGSFENDKSPYGAYDMAGNVQEWTSSNFVAYPGNSSKEVIFDPKKKVVRGSYYGGNDFLARCSMRFCALPGSLNVKPEGDNYSYIGFRCAMDVD